MAEKIAIIGGSGLGDAFVGDGGRSVEVDTPFGRPSGSLLETRRNGVDVVFLSRHGAGHLLNPSTVPYRANIFALKQVGVTTILASGAVGSLREDIEPGHVVICDQVIDKTIFRPGTFFDDGIAAHVEHARPFCDRTRQLLVECGERTSARLHRGGTYVCMEGPQFSTKAESLMHRQWGGDLIGMTCMPEAKLAREAEMCYALIALPTDYDCWRPHESDVAPNALMKQVIANLHRATAGALELIDLALSAMSEQGEVDCPCRDSLAMGIWSDKSKVSGETVERLRPLIGRYFAD